ALRPDRRAPRGGAALHRAAAARDGAAGAAPRPRALAGGRGALRRERGGAGPLPCDAPARRPAAARPRRLSPRLPARDRGARHGVLARGDRAPRGAAPPRAGDGGSDGGAPRRLASARRRLALAAGAAPAPLAVLALRRGHGGEAHYTGFVEGEERVLRSEVSGRVQEVAFREGDRVPANAVVARLDDSEIAARIASREQEI